MGRYGAILADEMGLGKTLQSVALSWTLLKQGPYGGKPVAKRVLVVTPGSLVQNWGAEFNKWLGRERISVFTVDQVRKGEEIPSSGFTTSSSIPMLASVKRLMFLFSVCQAARQANMYETHFTTSKLIALYTEENSATSKIKKILGE